MDAYSRIAEFYDDFNAFDYEDYLKKCFKNIEKKPKGNLALDCGCGTGKLLSLLAKDYDCTGVDISEEMLSVAATKEELKKVNFVCQPLEELDLYGAYDYVFCSLDTVNHLTDKRALKAFFKRISNFVEPNGVFVFDIKAPKKMKKGVKTDVFEDEDKTLIWQGFLKRPYVLHRLTVFSPEKGYFKKEETEIEERIYTRPEIRQMMKASPLILEKTFTYKNERTVFIYRKK